MKFVIILLASFFIQGWNEVEIKILSSGIDVNESLEQLKLQKKFTDDSTLFYPGAPDESARVAAE